MSDVEIDGGAGKSVAFSVVACSLVLLIILFGYMKPDKGKGFFVVGTASVSGVYYPVGSALCRIVNQKHQDKYKCSVQSNAGSIYNVNSLRSGVLGIAVVQNDWLYNAYHGSSVFSSYGPMENLRAVVALHTESLTIASRSDVKADSFLGTEGYRFNVGMHGTGSRGTVDALMKHIGRDPDEMFKLASDLRSSEQAQALCDRKLDVLSDMIGHPNGGMTEASTLCGIRLIGLDDSVIKSMVAKYPYYSRVSIPCSYYNRCASGDKCPPCKDVNSLGVQAFLVSTSDIDDELVYSVTKAMVENFDYFRSIHPVFSDMDVSYLVPRGTSVPIHEGAKRYYKEAGLL